MGVRDGALGEGGGEILIRGEPRHRERGLPAHRAARVADRQGEAAGEQAIPRLGEPARRGDRAQAVLLAWRVEQREDEGQGLGLAITTGPEGDARRAAMEGTPEDEFDLAPAQAEE